MTTILVVDDNAVNRELIVTLARHRGHSTIEAADGAEALNAVKQTRPDLIVCDILMPTMDGFEFVRRLRADPAIASIEVIFYTAHYREREARNLAQACGVRRVIGKPCEPGELLKAVDDALAGIHSTSTATVPSTFDEEHLRLLNAKLADKAQELERRNLRMSALTDLNLQLASEGSPRELLAKVCRGARDLIGASIAILVARDKYVETETHMFVAGMGDEAARNLPRPQLAEGWAGDVFIKRKSARTRIPNGDATQIGLPPGFPPIHAALAVAVASLNNQYGWLLLGNKLGEAEFEDEDEHILSILGAQVGRIYENGTLSFQLRQRAEQLQMEIAARERTAQSLVGMLARQEALRLVDERILGAESAAEVARVALEYLRHTVPYWAASVVSLQSDGPMRVLARLGDASVLVTEHDGHLTESVYGISDLEELRNGKFCFVGDLSIETELSALPLSMKSRGMRSYVRIPMLLEGRLIAILNLASNLPRAFSADQIEFAQAMANHLGIAIQQTNLREKVRRQADELEEKVEERTFQLQQAVDELQAFSYSVSHDLRAPLRAIQGFARLLEQEHQTQLNEDGRALLGVIRKSSDRMDELINDLLRFSQVGRTAINPHQFDTGTLVHEAWVGIANAKPTRLSVGTLPASMGDPNLLRQVWINLLSNACKYSSKSLDPQVQVTGVVQGGETVFCVADNGAGFDQRYADKLFAVFQRLHSESEFPGTGVGLAIVHRIVTRHGGRVWAEGEPGSGARFYFSLPGRNTG